MFKIPQPTASLLYQPWWKPMNGSSMTDCFFLPQIFSAKILTLHCQFLITPLVGLLLEEVCYHLCYLCHFILLVCIFFLHIRGPTMIMMLCLESTFLVCFSSPNYSLFHSLNFPSCFKCKAAYVIGSHGQKDLIILFRHTCGSSAWHTLLPHSIWLFMKHNQHFHACLCNDHL